jgi:hypothetical protein
MSELTKNDIPTLIEAAKIACGYCGDRNWLSDKSRTEFHQRPFRDGVGFNGEPSKNFQHGGGTYCKVYMLWNKIEELECQIG